MSTSARSGVEAAALRSEPQTEQILGIPFFNGTPTEAVERVLARGGLVVAPSGTCFERLVRDADYRRAVTSADIALADSGFMVLLWRFLRRRHVRRISGYAYLQHLFADARFQQSSIVWVLPHDRARQKLLHWATTPGAVRIRPEQCYLAPMYDADVRDEQLLGLIGAAGAQHVVIAVGAGPQEKLGWYLRENSAPGVAIHCTGGALGFITGDQVRVPGWADRLFLGWFFRLLTQPRVFVPRLWRGRVLPWLILRYGSKLPPLAREN